MNNLPRFFMKMNPWSILIAYGLSFFYFVSSLFLFTQGIVGQAILCLGVSAFFAFTVFLNKVALLSQYKVAKIATVLRSLQGFDFKQDNETKSKLILFLFDLDAISFRLNKKTINEVFWFKKNYRPNSSLISSIVDSFLAKKLMDGKIELSSEEILLIAQEQSLLKQSLIEINAKVKQDFPELESIPENTVIRFK